MSDVTCRHAQAKDMTRIKEIVRLSFESAAEDPDVIDDLENETWFSVEHWLVAESDGAVVSALGLRPGVMWIVGVPVPATTVGTAFAAAYQRLAVRFLRPAGLRQGDQQLAGDELCGGRHRRKDAGEGRGGPG